MSNDDDRQPKPDLRCLRACMELDFGSIIIEQ
jgi:hypothetical protein